MNSFTKSLEILSQVFVYDMITEKYYNYLKLADLCLNFVFKIRTKKKPKNSIISQFFNKL